MNEERNLLPIIEKELDLKPFKRYSEDEKEDLLGKVKALQAEGFSMREAADRLGVSVGSLSAWGGTKTTPETQTRLEEIKGLLDEGHSITECAKIMHIAKQTAYQYARLAKYKKPAKTNRPKVYKKAPKLISLPFETPTPTPAPIENPDEKSKIVLEMLRYLNAK